MWINFRSKNRFAIKIHLGGVNAVSGETMVENAATKLRRLNLIASKKSVQDYIITPDQLWLDGVASHDSRVRQFVAMPLGSGYSVEAQVTGEEVVGGLQFEITPAPRPPLVITLKKARDSAVMGNNDPVIRISVVAVVGETIVSKGTTMILEGVAPSTTIVDIKHVIEEHWGVPMYQQRLHWSGGTLENGDPNSRSIKMTAANRYRSHCW